MMVEGSGNVILAIVFILTYRPLQTIFRHIGSFIGQILLYLQVKSHEK